MSVKSFVSLNVNYECKNTPKSAAGPGLAAGLTRRRRGYIRNRPLPGPGMIKKIDDFRFEIPAEGAMRVPGRIFASKTLISKSNRSGWPSR